MRLSQGPIIASNTPNTEKKRPAPAPHKPPSQKRARLEEDDKENRIRQHVETWKVKHNVKKEHEKDEKALMDDLMAGLDASMFSSPVKSQLSQTRGERVMSPVRMGGRVERQRSPVKPIKAERPRSPLKATIPANRPIIPIPTNHMTNEVKRVPKAFIPIKLEVELEVPKPIPEVTIDIKPVLEDDDEFTFDFDLDELAGMDDDILLKPHAAARPIYPVKNPEVPSPPVGYSSTPWLRCSVELVLDGLRFGDGVIPDVLDFSGAGPSTAVGKVGQAVRLVFGADVVDSCSDGTSWSSTSGSPQGALG